MTKDELEAQLLVEETRYNDLVSKAAGASLKLGEVDVWTLARHARQNCSQIRSMLRELP